MNQHDEYGMSSFGLCSWIIDGLGGSWFSGCFLEPEKINEHLFEKTRVEIADQLISW